MITKPWKDDTKVVIGDHVLKTHICISYMSPDDNTAKGTILGANESPQKNMETSPGRTWTKTGYSNIYLFR